MNDSNQPWAAGSKRICVLSGFPPCRFNLGTTTALLYHLLDYLPAGWTVDLHYFSHTVPPARELLYARDLEALALNRAVHIPRPSRWRAEIFRRCVGFRKLPRGVAHFPVNGRVLREINRGGYDAVWVYPHWLAAWGTRLSCPRVVVTGPDAGSLHHARVLRLGRWSTAADALREADLMRRNENLENFWASTAARLHLVGEEDVRRFNVVTGTQGKAFFSRHPLYEHGTISQALDRAGKRLSVLLAGDAHTAYVGDYLDRLITALCGQHGAVGASFQFTFVGRKFEPLVVQMRRAGLDARHEPWVEDMSEELARHHLQIFPIAVGTGTKGKVLHAMATGLLAVGTAFAFENIAAEPGQDCVLFREPEQVPGILADVAANRERYAAMAARGCAAVRREHDPAKCAAEFWGHFEERAE